MDNTYQGKVAVITGGAGVLCREMAVALAKRQAEVVILDINGEAIQSFINELKAYHQNVLGIQTDVLNKKSLESAKDQIISRFGKVDILINGAGGNKAQATTGESNSFFSLAMEDIKWVFDLNFISAVLSTQVFGKVMAENDYGIVVNISSMAAFRPLTNTIAYSTAKAAINNFTSWMAVHFNENYSRNIRVNAIAPGFFLTNQNQYLLVNQETGKLTQRSEKIIELTPMGRFGDPGDLISTLLWLVSDESRFVNGIVVPVDGGFSAYCGV